MSPKVREVLYYLGTIIPGVMGLALILGAIDQGTADHLTDVIMGILAMLGATAPAVAAKNVRSQRKDGTLDTPAERIVSDVQKVIATQQTAQAEFAKVQTAITAAVSQIPVAGPVVGPLTNQILNTPNVLLDNAKRDLANYAATYYGSGGGR